VPPAGFIERASSIFPNLIFDLQGTTEHELYERWLASGGNAVQVEEQLVNLENDEVLRWIKDGEILVGPTQE
jgi:hypothetical protein